MIFVVGIILVAVAGSSLLSLLLSSLSNTLTTLRLQSFAAEYGAFFGDFFESLSIQLYFDIFHYVIVLIIGILCIKFAPKKEKAVTVIGFGVALIALQIINTTLSLINFDGAFSSLFSGLDLRGFDPSILDTLFVVIVIISGIIGLILPALLIVGGNQRRNAES